MPLRLQLETLPALTTLHSSKSLAIEPQSRPLLPVNYPLHHNDKTSLTDASNVQPLAIITAEKLHTGHSNKFQRCTFHTAKDELVVVDNRGTVYDIDLTTSTGGEYGSYTCLTRIGQQSTALCTLPSSLLAIGTTDTCLRLYDSKYGQLLQTLKGGHTQPIHQIVYNNNQYVLICSRDRSILWLIQDAYGIGMTPWQQQCTLPAHVQHAAFGSDGRTVYTLVAKDSTVRVFTIQSSTNKKSQQQTAVLTEVATLEVPFTEQAPNHQLQTICLTNDNATLVAAGNGNSLYLFSTSTYQLLQIIELPINNFSITKLQAVAHTSTVITCMSDIGTIYYIDISTQQILLTVPIVNNTANIDYAHSASNHWLSTISQAGTLQLYDINEVIQPLLTPYLYTPPPAQTASKTPSRVQSALRSNITQSLPTTVEPLLPNADTADQKQKALALLDIRKIRLLLERYNEFPSKHRLLLWRFILRLPENHVTYHALLQRGIHPAYAQLHRQYPIKSQRLYRRLQRLLSCLAHYSPLFATVDYLPALVFPFIKTIPHNDDVVFELMLTLLLNVSVSWFELHPTPPVALLQKVDSLLELHDKQLHTHLTQTVNATALHYAWPIIHTMYATILQRDDWLVLFDHILVNQPAFFYYILTALLIHLRETLMSCTNLSTLNDTLQHAQPVSIRKLVQDAQQIRSETSTTMQSELAQTVTKRSANSHQWQYLPVGSYPSFEPCYPKQVVDYQLKERERIEFEHEQRLEQRSLIERMKAEEQDANRKNQEWQKEAQLLANIEESRRRQLGTAAHIRQRELELLERKSNNSRLSQLEAQEAALRQYLTSITQQRQQSLAGLENDIHQRNEHLRRQVEREGEREKLRTLELENEKRLLALAGEQQVQRERERMTRAREATTHTTILEDELRATQWRRDDELQRARMSAARDQREKLIQVNEQLRAEQEIAARQLQEQLNRQLTLSDVERKRAVRQFESEAATRQAMQADDLQRKQRILQSKEVTEYNRLIAEEKRHRDEQLAQRQNILRTRTEQIERESVERAERLLQLEREQQRADFEARLREIHHDATQSAMHEERHLGDVLTVLEREQLKDQRLEAEIRRRQDEVDERVRFQQRLHAVEQGTINAERERFARLRVELQRQMSTEELRASQEHEDNLQQLLQQREAQLARLRSLWQTGVRQREVEELQREYEQSQTQIDQQRESMRQAEEQLRERFGVGDAQARAGVAPPRQASAPI